MIAASIAWEINKTCHAAQRFAIRDSGTDFRKMAEPVCASGLADCYDPLRQEGAVERSTSESWITPARTAGVIHTYERQRLLRNGNVYLGTVRSHCFKHSGQSGPIILAAARKDSWRRMVFFSSTSMRSSDSLRSPIWVGHAMHLLIIFSGKINNMSPFGDRILKRSS